MLNPDRFEDYNFRCIQTKGVAAQARDELCCGTASVTKDEHDNDPFVDCEETKNWKLTKL